MPLTETSLKQIADILSYKSNTSTIQDAILRHSINWDTIVRQGSQHLVLPAIYCRLQQKDLLAHIPKDLKDYLEEITAINRNRNISLLDEVHEISKLFNEYDINHVFLKGAALLSANYYQDLGERMIGDIDILVDRLDLDKAYNLLLNKRYSSIQETISDKYLNKRHMPRLVNETKMGAVEIHSHLLNKKHNSLLESSLILKNKKLVNSISIPENTALLAHNILNYQINDHGYYFNNMHLRNAYDTLLILQKAPNYSYTENTYVKNYFYFLSVLFDDIPKFDQSLISTIRLKLIEYRLKNPNFNDARKSFLNKILYTDILFNRFKLFVLNKQYRKDLLKKYKIN